MLLLILCLLLVELFEGAVYFWSEFSLLYPCEIIPTQMPIQTNGKDNKRVAARLMHAVGTSILDVIATP